jgi:DUF4097 and DUF4098 domain-containing protein YvlB
MRRGLVTIFVFVAALLAVASNRGSMAGAVAPLGNSTGAQTATSDEVREEFHRSVPLTAGGRVSIENINGSVRIAVWDQNEVKIDAVKRAYKRERLNEARIEVDATSDAVRIKTRYPYENLTFTDEESRRYDNPAIVDYSLTIPRKARLESAELVNGALEIEGVEGDVKASCINGHLTARGLVGEVKLSTINGTLDATFTRLDESKAISLNSVNGRLLLTIPSDSNATLKASTVHGGITNDFGLTVQHGEWVGHELYGQLGTGGPRIRLGNVNGSITIKHAADGRTLSQATGLLSDKGKDKDKEKLEKELAEARRKLNEDVRRTVEEARRQALSQTEIDRITAEAQREAQRAIREAELELARAQREVQLEVTRAQREAQRETQRAVQEQTREMTREINRQAREQARLAREQGTFVIGSGRGLVDRESKSFVVTGTPTVNVGTFDGAIVVHGWDKSEVMYTATRRGRNEEILKQVKIEANQQGSAITIIATGEGSNGSAHLELYVPRNSNLHVTSDDGHLSIDGVSGDLNVRTGDGSIEVTTGHGQLQANTGDGRIHILDFDGQVDARTGDGSISLTGRFTALSARTGDGSISLAVPANSSFVVETNADAISNEGLNVSEDVAPSTRVKRWKVGNGGAVFKLNTGDGRVILKAR